MPADFSGPYAQTLLKFPVGSTRCKTRGCHLARNANQFQFTVSFEDGSETDLPTPHSRLTNKRLNFSDKELL